MASPTVSASLDKSSYTTGELMTLTVRYGDADNATATDTITVTGTDQDDNATVVTVEREMVTVDQVTLSISDSAGKTWTEVSNTGSVAEYTATA